MWRNKLVKGFLFIGELMTEGFYQHLLLNKFKELTLQSSSYLRRELKHGCTNNQRC